ncbi:MAG TPA: transaldolase [Flavobacteriales bacterium]|nr:transaldolase [Flavobacteriales bacterium]
MKIKIFLDGANLEEILQHKDSERVSGFTTNPSLMRKAGVEDYMGFTNQLSDAIPKEKHVSLEVIADELEEMERQALKLAEVSENFYAKIPITNTKGEFTGPVIKKLGEKGVKVNVTAIMTVRQVKELSDYLSPTTPSVVSVFAGRIADTGINPVSTMTYCKGILRLNPVSELLWASCRETYSIYQADKLGCDIITVPSSILKKLSLKDKDLEGYSLETVQDFYKDAQAANYSL